ncbi:MAG: SnoaL-like domain [Thermoplasmata archaeon]|jgi:ketosteroid isomerase-like protein|nr:SnoaL-like domain [Thermoplasmata archaeon]
MVTVGRGVLDPAVHEFFDGVRSYDAKRAAVPLAEDVDFESPWSGRLTGRAAVEAFLKAWLADAQKRPTFSIIDVAGDGAVTRMKVSVSGRFGKAPEHYTLEALCLKHVLHHVAFRPVGGPAPGH